MFEVRNHGCLRSPEDPHDWKLGTLLGKSPTIPGVERIDFRAAHDILDQGPTSSCVAQAIAGQVRLTARLAGKPIGLPARKGIYSPARLLDMPGEPLADVGCTPRNGYKACAKVGLVAEERFPFTFDSVNDPLPWDVARAGAGAQLIEGKDVGYWRAFTGAEIRQALVRGLPVTFGMPVDDAYEAYFGGVYEGRAGAIRGYHAQMIVGFAPGIFFVANSWGTSWGEAGFCRMSADYLLGSECFDFYAVSVTPEYLQ